MGRISTDVNRKYRRKRPTRQIRAPAVNSAQMLLFRPFQVEKRGMGLNQLATSSAKTEAAVSSKKIKSEVNGHSLALSFLTVGQSRLHVAGRHTVR